MCNRLLIDIPIENLNLNRLDINGDGKQKVIKTYNDPFIVFCNEFENCVFLFQKYLNLKNKIEISNDEVGKEFNEFVFSIAAKYINSGITFKQVIKLLNFNTDYVTSENKEITIFLECKNDLEKSLESYSRKTEHSQIYYKDEKEHLMVCGKVSNEACLDNYKRMAEFIKEYVSLYFLFIRLNESQFSKIIINYSSIFRTFQEEEKTIVSNMLNKFIIDYGNKNNSNENGFNIFSLYEYVLLNYIVFKPIIEKLYIKLGNYLGKPIRPTISQCITNTDNLFCCIKNINYSIGEKTYRQMSLKIKIVSEDNSIFAFNLKLLTYPNLFSLDSYCFGNLSTFDALLLNRTIFQHIEKLNYKIYKSKVCNDNRLKFIFHAFLEWYHYADGFSINRWEQVIKLLLKFYKNKVIEEDLSAISQYEKKNETCKKDILGNLNSIVNIELYTVEKYLIEALFMQQDASVYDFIVNNHLNEHKLSINDFIKIYIKQSCQKRKCIKEFKLACEDLKKCLGNSENGEPQTIDKKNLYDLEENRIKNEKLQMLYF